MIDTVGVRSVEAAGPIILGRSTGRAGSRQARFYVGQGEETVMAVSQASLPTPATAVIARFNRAIQYSRGLRWRFALAIGAAAYWMPPVKPGHDTECRGRTSHHLDEAWRMAPLSNSALP
ncbi:hypothetical protein BJA01nite_35790 [Bradyrhizobium japonicum]|nr:hypothetical protein CF64_04175 [Bradyrhizobium japonicum]BAL07253.1 hypothetical protein BJ6T_19730 [Bradyrhizobium japonicum USDA 6]GEC45937.1 hypothetical protein BJA01nite_35790 [Bradyrhizobium japonicum]